MPIDYSVLGLPKGTPRCVTKRLSTVLVPSGPATNAAGIGQSAPAISSPMAEGLRMLGYRADGAIARVQDIISRLEL